MKLILTIGLLFTSVSHAQIWGRREIEAYVTTEAGEAGNIALKVEEFKLISGLPKDSTFSLWPPSLLFETAKQTYFECAASGCYWLEREWFQQLAELRFERRNSRTHWIGASPIKISLCIYRKWSSDEAQNRKQILKQEIQLHTISFL